MRPLFYYAYNPFDSLKNRLPQEYRDMIFHLHPTIHFSIPQEIVANNPFDLLRYMKNWPTARGWNTHLYAVEKGCKELSEFVPYAKLMANLKDLGLSFHGTSHHEELVIIENWENYGDDGHTGYRLMGYIFVAATYLSHISFAKVKALIDNMDWNTKTWK